MKVAFIGHPAHRSTKSSRFFLDLLSDHDITTFFPSQGDYQSCLEIEKSQYDRVICWQYDFFAPYFISKNIPTIVVPMFDGTGGKPEEYWLKMRGALFINFSWHLHLKILGFGLNSLYAKYYCNPTDYEVAKFKHGELNAFVWQRNPSVINWQTVISCSGPQLTGLHVHNVPDVKGAYFPSPLPGVAEAYNISESTWFEDRNELDRILDSCNVYFAPRTAEGIGMGMIEAMSRGMCVVAHDLPTHNEYLANRVNGILYRANDPNWLVDLSEAEHYGKLARKTVVTGYQNWLEQVPSIVSMIENAEIGQNPNLSQKDTMEEINRFFRG